MKVLKAYDYDDLLLLPKKSDIISRDLVDLSVNLYNVLELKIPIVASPMKGIISVDLIKGLSRLGGIGILHRFFDSKLEWQASISQLKDYNFGVAIGLEDDNFYKKALDNGVKIVCIDVANGYIKSVLDKVKEVKEYIISKGYIRQCLLMAGNVATYQGAWNLYLSGAELIRVGIGSGTLCITRNVTGVGCPQLTAIDQCYDEKAQWTIVADGGIRNSGDAVKALAMGAELVMLGSLLGKTNESSNNGIIYGMASRKLQEEYYQGVKSIEGIEKEMKKEISLVEFINEFTYGIRSACTYLNANNLDELRKNAQWVETGKGTLK